MIETNSWFLDKNQFTWKISSKIQFISYILKNQITFVFESTIYIRTEHILRLGMRPPSPITFAPNTQFL